MSINTSVIENLVMVKLTIKKVTGVRKAAQVNEDAEQKYGVDPKALRISLKQIHPSFTRELNRAISTMRSFWYERTLPWENDTAWRVVPTSKFQELSDGIARLKSEVEVLGKALVDQYDEMKKKSKEYMGQLFDDNMFPTKEQLKAGLVVDFQMGAVASPDDARLVGMDKQARDRVRAEIERRYEEQMKISSGDLLSRLLSGLKDLKERLDDPDQKNKKYSRFLADMKGMCDAVRGLNVTKNSEIESAATEILMLLSNWTGDDLKDMPMIRKTITGDAAKIEDKLRQLTFS